MTQPVFLVAGGTGGHVFPALAVAEILIGRGINVECITDKRGARFFSNTNVTPHIVSSSTFAGNWKQKAMASVKIGYGLLQGFEMCREYSPAAVVGFGGYPSFPMMFAAQFLKIPTIVHESNAVFGRANRKVAAKTKFIATSFAETKHIHPAHVSKIVQTGNPLRKYFSGDFTYPAPKKDEPLHVLIFGGSQGSSLFSKIVPAAVELIDPDLRKNLTITQQCRPEDMDAVTLAYNRMAVSARLQPFFTDMPKLYKRAHLVIGRAGGSVAEITVTGRPSLLVPFANSLDGDQAQNAQRIVANKAGWLMEEKDFTPENLAAKLTEILRQPDLLADAAERSKELGKPDAAERLADLVMQVMDK